MQANYSELPNVVSVADAQRVTQPETTSMHLLAYRGATYAKSEVGQMSTSQIATLRSLPSSVQLKYRGTTYKMNETAGISSTFQQTVNQKLTYRGVNY